MFVCHAKAPRVLSDAQRANLGQHDVDNILERAFELRETMKKHFAEWWDDLSKIDEAPLERPSGDAVLPTAYWSKDNLTLGWVCSHHTVLILLNQLFIDAGHPDSKALMHESQKAATEICKCAFQTQTQLVGSMYMRYWLIVAADGCAPEHYAWIMSRLDCLKTSAGSWNTGASSRIVISA